MRNPMNSGTTWGDPYDRPATNNERMAWFALLHHAHQKSPTHETWESLAWLHNSRKNDYANTMGSEWNLGRLVMRGKDWTLGIRNYEVYEKAPIDPDMVVAPIDKVEFLRELFQGLTRNPPQPNSHEVYESKRLDAWRKAFHAVARHIATGHKRLYHGPASDGILHDPGSDPLRCRVDGCESPAYLLEGRRGASLAMEAVCCKDSSHRWNPFAGPIIREAAANSFLFCPYCGSPDTEPGPMVEVGRGKPMYPARCVNCPEYFLLPIPFNPPLRMEWIAEGVHEGRLEAALQKRGMPLLKDLRGAKGRNRSKESVTAKELELHRLQQFMERHEGAFDRPWYRTPSEVSNKLRYRMWEDIREGHMEPRAFYEAYGTQYLDLERDEARRLVASGIKFFEHNGFIHDYGSKIQSRQHLTRFLSDTIQADIAKGGTRQKKRYKDLLQEKWPDTSREVAQTVFQRVVQELATGPDAEKVQALLPHNRRRESSYIKQLIDADLTSSRLRPLRYYQERTAEAFPDFKKSNRDSLVRYHWKKARAAFSREPPS